ncbi:MAG TPA: aminopeptidase [Bacteroidia bacterium]|jgi:predicted aminopeptidase|nr:aminopeptidase [Bacteroidia bacterium]
MKLRIFFGFTFNIIAMLCFVWLLCNAALSIYLLKMGQGQMNLILNTKKIEEVLKNDSLTAEQKEKLLLVEKIKKYSVDSLGYKPTKNFTTYFNQKGQPVLWIVTACKPFRFEAYEWKFPMIGKVSYKGFFNRNTAMAEYLRLLRLGYDADLSTVSAWSTLGWLPDPILSSMLRRSKGRLANLLFHELFHATYYARGTVNINENLANFISYKATLKFLANDTIEMRRFCRGAQDDSIYNKFIFEEYENLREFYKKTEGMDSLKRAGAKQLKLQAIYRKAGHLPFQDPARFEYANRSILATKNAFFIDAQRYDGLYDSLNGVLNGRYKGNLRQMIEDLKK